MSFENILFIVFTLLSGFVISFLITFLSIKISKILIFIGIILYIVFFLFVNGSFSIIGIDISGIFQSNFDKLGNNIYDIKEMLIKNIPLTLGVITGVYYGIKKAI